MNSVDFRAIFFETHESSVVEDHAAMLSSGHGETDVGACVIVLSIVVHNAAFQILIFELGIAVPFRAVKQKTKSVRQCWG